MDSGHFPNDPQDKTELMERIHRAWYALERTISNLSDTQLTVPEPGGWNIQDNLAHLAAWEQILMQCHLHKHPLHEALGISAQARQELGENGINALIYERSQKSPVSEVLTTFRHTHQQLLAELEHLSFEDLLKPRDADDPEKRPLLGWVIGNTYEHYQEHRSNIEKLIDSWK